MIDTKEQIDLDIFEKPWNHIRLSSYGIACIINGAVIARKMYAIDKEIYISPATGLKRLYFLHDEPHILYMIFNDTIVKLFNLKTNELIPVSTPDGNLFQFRDDGMYMTISTEKAVKDFLAQALPQVAIEKQNSNCNN